MESWCLTCLTNMVGVNGYDRGWFIMGILCLWKITVVAELSQAGGGHNFMRL